MSLVKYPISCSKADAVNPNIVCYYLCDNLRFGLGKIRLVPSFCTLLCAKCIWIFLLLNVLRTNESLGLVKWKLFSLMVDVVFCFANWLKDSCDAVLPFRTFEHNVYGDDVQKILLQLFNSYSNGNICSAISRVATIYRLRHMSNTLRWIYLKCIRKTNTCTCKHTHTRTQ